MLSIEVPVHVQHLRFEVRREEENGRLAVVDDHGSEQVQQGLAMTDPYRS
jgi:hypothetical protein